MRLLPASRLVRVLLLLAVGLALVTGGASWYLLRPRGSSAWVSLDGPPPLAPPVVVPVHGLGERYTVTYDVRDLLDYAVREPTAFYRGQRSGPQSMHELIDIIVRISPTAWDAGSGARIAESNGTHLEIHARKAMHDEVVDILAALRRLGDVAVQLQTQLYEVPRACYDTTVAPALKTNQAPEGSRFGGTVASDVLAEIVHQGGKPRPGSAAMVPNGESVLLFSQRQAVVLPAAHGTPPMQPDELERRLPTPTATALTGVAVTATVVVTMDRRGTLLTLEQQSSTEAGQRVQNTFDDNAKPLVLVHPNIVRTVTKSAPIEVMDGDALVLPLPTLPARDAGRVPVLVIRTDIYIEAEQKALNDEGGRMTQTFQWLKRALR